MAIGGIGSNIGLFAKALRQAQRQVPFAAATALTSTAFQGRKRIVDVTYRRAFTVRNAGFPRRAFRVKKARKTDLTAAIFDDLGRASLKLHARGGLKRPRGGTLAIPSKNVRRGARGVVKSQRPAALRTKPKVFKARLRKAAPAIWQQTRRGRKLLFTLERSVRIDRRFDFDRDLRRLIKARLRPEFAKAYARALRTAR